MDDWRFDERQALVAGGLDADLVDLMVEWAALWNEGNADSIAHFVAPDVTFNDQRVGIAGLKGMIDRVRSSFPDMHISTREAFAVGDRVVLRLHWAGTHLGDWASPIGILPASGAPFAIDGAEIYQHEAGRIVAGWMAWDRSLMIRAFGVVAGQSAEQRKRETAGQDAPADII